MKLRAAVVALILAAVAGGASLRRTSALQTPLPSSSTSVALLITLGEKATRPERWDGSAQVSGGRLLATEGRHFSSEDAVTGAGAWRAVARQDEVAPYADIHYTEMRPGARPDVLFYPVGVYLTIEPGAATRVAVETAQGKFDFPLSDATATRPLSFLDGRASVVRVPVTEKITTAEFEDDEPAIASLSNGSIAIAWVAYKDRADRILLRTRAHGSWSAAEQVTTTPGDIFRCSLVSDSAGSLWVFWSERENQRWHIWARQKQGQTWQAAQRVSGEGSNTFHRAAAASGGPVFVVWQSFRKGQSDIFLRKLAGGKWSEEIRVSESPANDWEPAVAAGPQDAAYIAWDSYDKGNYDIQFRSFKEGRLSPVQFVTTSPRFEAHASVAVDSQSRPWVAWDESGVNWGKDQGFLIPAPLSVPLHKERTVRIALGDGGKWMEPARAGALPLALRENSEHPQILFDAKGALRMVFRHWTRRNSRAIGSPQVWENYLTHLDGDHWVVPRPLSNSGGSIEKHAAVTRDSLGEGWAAWMTDGRPFSTMIPQNADIYVSRLDTIEAAPPATQSFGQLASSSEEAIPVHSTESEDIRAIRAYSISSGGKQFRIFRGDMHRHTDVSQDFKYDGSLIEVYRYGLDAAGFDYIAPTDHQTGFDQEFTWWQNQKLVDLFLIPGSFTPLFAYERSLRFPNGHRNIVFAHRGVRTFPIPANEASGEVGAARLFEHLRQNRGISMPHSSATAQGTDWRDNDPEIEPLMEIYQGYRTSYEYEGAPRAASRLNQHIQKSGWQPEGFLWNALAKGYKLGVQASSDHWSTHISYACLLSENFTREGLFDAIRRRHAYAATDNIILDFRARSQGALYIMGDSFSSQSPPQLSLRVFGTGAIKQIDLIKNQSLIYTVRPATKQANFEFTDQTFGKGENYYYVRVLQEDGQLAWSSPIWIEKR